MSKDAISENLDDLNQAKLIINSLVRMITAKKIFSISLNFILIGVLTYLLLELLFISIANYVVINSIVLFSGVYFFLSINSEIFKAINKKNVLEHINRKIPKYQESSQIILNQNYSPIKNILRNNIVSQLISDDKQGILKKAMPSEKWKTPIILLAMIILINVFSNDLNMIIAKWGVKNEAVQKLQLTPNKNEIASVISIDLVEVIVSPPKYTNLKEFVSKKLDISIPENSMINWNVSLIGTVKDVYIIFTSTDSQKNKFKMLYNKETKRYFFNHKIEQTQIYNFEVVANGISKIPNGVYSIVVVKDQSPKVKIVNPKQSLVEFPMHGNHSFSLSANVIDDYGITDVNIIASVAKGSGEAVKFRDKIFVFDEMIKEPNNASKKVSFNYKKQWQLKKLDMEPGDEVYFHIIATDNRQPNTQQSKSNSVIVRWLDDDEIELSTEGVRIGFVPEYFRSQRQIIIETIELIEDRNDLATTDFNAKSVDLGHSQGDLKTKYGQYLGDEFGEGAGEHFGLADGYHGESEVENAGTMNTHEEIKKDDEHHSEHEDNEGAVILGDGNALIAEFTHNHGTEEIAPLSDRDPKTWMKMAVSEMWQAELYLMLSEPSKALPFEKNAYKYLKEARKADRIYAKRLGFEPPPVTEDRRLSGELNELGSSYINTKGFTKQKSSQKIIGSAYTLINQWKLLNEELQKSFELSFEHNEIIDNLKIELLELAKTRPVLVKYVAILEQISLSKKLSLQGCVNCIGDLQQRLWSLLPTPRSLPSTKVDTMGLNNQSKKLYLKSIRKLIDSSDVRTRGQNDER
ncbi:MAG: hypothetical protein ACJAS9_002905 [Polaribacter sp.]|jgi:hypothetical protein